MQKLLLLPELNGVVIIDCATDDDPFNAIIGWCPPDIMPRPTVEWVNSKLTKDIETPSILVNTLTASWTHVGR